MKKVLAVNFLLLSGVFFGVFFLAEMYFRFKGPLTDGFGASHSSSRWMRSYWKPINSLGYRDLEPSKINSEYLVVGDSFVAGYGIKNVESRFSNVLARRLDSAGAVNVIAQNGWGPTQQLAAFNNYPVIADVVLFSYYINDIDEVAMKGAGMEWSSPELASSLLAKIMYKAGSYSHAIDWFNISILYPRRLAESSKSYMQMISKAYSDEYIFAEHMAQIDDLVEAANSVGSQPVFILWPNMVDPLSTEWMVAKVKAYLQARGIPVANLSRYALSFDMDKRIVNRLDSHPSEELNNDLGIRLARCLPYVGESSAYDSFQMCIDGAA